MEVMKCFHMHNDIWEMQDLSAQLGGRAVFGSQISEEKTGT